MSKLGVHVSAGNRRGFGEFLKACSDAGSPVPVVFAVDQDVWPDVQHFSPQTIVIYRHQPRTADGSGLDGPEDAYHGDPVKSAQRWMAANMVAWRKNRAHYYAPINEQDAGTLPGYTWLNTFSLECLRIADENGFKLALYGFSGGNPRDGVTDLDRSTLEDKWTELIPSLRYAKQHGHILLLHEYGFGSGAANGGPATSLRASAPHLALRYRRSYHFLHRFQADPPLVISEAGAGVGGFEGLGQSVWLEDAQWYDRELMRDRVVLGCCLYQVGGDENIQDALPALGTYVAATPTIAPEGDPVIGCDEESDEMPVDYVVIAHLLPQDATKDEARQVIEVAHAAKQSVVYSADDARRLVRPGQPGSKVIVWAPQRWADDIVSWLDVAVETRQFETVVTPPPPLPSGNAWRGLHLRADGHSGQLDYQCLSVGRLNAAKIMTNTGFEELAALIARGIQPTRIVLRLFADFRGRTVTPIEFVEWQRLWLTEFARVGGRYVEIHNEPNLIDEGLGQSWQSAAGFAGWYQSVVALIRANWPTLLCGYPGLSPSGGWVDPRGAVELWTATLPALVSMQAVDWIGVHCYWQDRGQMTSPDHGRFYERFLALGRLLIITEFSNNSAAVSYSEKGAQYREYYASLPARVLGAMAFVSSASNPDFNARRECWVTNGVITPIATEVGR
jgi:hypothetical protein